MPEELGEVIAERVVTISKDGKSKEARIEIGRPVLEQGTAIWTCPFRTTGFGRAGIRQGTGSDSLHAIESCMRLAGIELHGYRREGYEIKLDGLDDFGLLSEADYQAMLDAPDQEFPPK